MTGFPAPSSAHDAVSLRLDCALSGRRSLDAARPGALAARAPAPSSQRRVIRLAGHSFQTSRHHNRQPG